MKAGVWKLSEVRKKMDEGIYPLRLGKEDIKHVCFSCPGTRKSRMEFLSRKPLDVHYGKILSSLNKALAKFRKVLKVK